MESKSVFMENKIVLLEKPKRNRKITTHKLWNNNINCAEQLLLVKNIQNKIVCNDSIILQQQINRKIQGYKQQDKLKKLFDELKFINIERIIELMINQEDKCYYCKESTILFYEKVREPKQWTLERINNKMGHNNDNCAICCLKCNVTRNTMYLERFKFTKELEIVKKT